MGRETDRGERKEERKGGKEREREKTIAVVGGTYVFCIKWSELLKGTMPANGTFYSTTSLEVNQQLLISQRSMPQTINKRPHHPTGMRENDFYRQKKVNLIKTTDIYFRSLPCISVLGH